MQRVATPVNTQLDFKLIREKRVDKLTTMKITKNLMSGRIFVEFVSTDPKLTLQKSFQDSRDGKKQSEEFSKSIKSTDQLKDYFGIKK